VEPVRKKHEDMKNTKCHEEVAVEEKCPQIARIFADFTFESWVSVMSRRGAGESFVGVQGC